MNIVLVVAVADNGVIGRDNAIPWRLKSDLQRFKKLTIGKPIVMGRKTYQSIGRPLPGRTNIVLTRDTGFHAAGIIVTASLQNALAIATGDALRRGAVEIAVIGGGDIYTQWMGIADRLEVTQVHATPPGDARFGPVDQTVWEETARQRHDAGPDDSVAFSYVTYRRQSHR